MYVKFFKTILISFFNISLTNIYLVSYKKEKRKKETKTGKSFILAGPSYRKLKFKKLGLSMGCREDESRL